MAKKTQSIGNNRTQQTLAEAFIEELRDVYDAERQLTRALPKMVKAATRRELRNALTNHLRETEGQVDRLEQVFDLLKQKASGKHCEGIAGIIKEASTMLKEAGSQFDEATMDARLIGAAQRVEHYEIAVYGTLIAWANELAYFDAAELLKETLEEEKAADDRLTTIAQEKVNMDAAEGADEADEEKVTASR